MPRCGKCFKDLTMTCAEHGANIAGEPSVQCDRDCAVWVRVTDSRNAPVPGVAVTVDGADKATDTLGFVGFEGLQPKEYAAQIPTNVADRFEPVARGEETRTGQGVEGQILLFQFKLTLRAELKIKVVQKGHPERVFARATVAITGGPSEGSEATGGDGIADFTYRSAGQYTAEVTLDPKDAEKFCAPEKKPFTLASGDVKTLVYEAEPIHEVTPVLEPVQARGWHDEESADHRVAAVFKVSLREDPSPSPYAGLGHVEVVSGDIALFKDEACQTPAASFSAADLRAGKPLYVKGSKVGKGRVKLRLDDPEDRVRVRVKDAVEEAVAIEKVNVIAPTLTADEVVLVHNGHLTKPTSLSKLTWGYTQTNATYPCDDLRVTLTYDNKIACSEEDKGVKPYASGTADAKLDRSLFVKGQTAGACTLTVKLSSASGAKHPSWRIAAEHTKTIRVEKLELEPYKFRDGKSAVDASYLVTRVTAPPKARELHLQNGAGDFTVARLVLKKPSDEFWAKATKVTLAAEAGVKIYSDATATTEVDAVQQGGFGGPELELWVKTTAAPAMDAEAGGAVDFATWARLLPEKVVSRCHVSCGATVNGKELVHGDLVALDTFAFDQYLDRKTRNECGGRLTAHPRPSKASLDLDVALACAGGHKFYDRLSGFKINKNYPTAGGGALLDEFCAAMNDPHGDNDSWSQDGLQFVIDHLQNNHGIALCGAMQTLIRAHIKRVLVARGHMAKYGFNQNHGVPGVHAEVLAVNEMLAAGVPVTEITVATYKLQRQGVVQGKRFVACTNCSGILMPPQVRVITG